MAVDVRDAPAEEAATLTHTEQRSHVMSCIQVASQLIKCLHHPAPFIH